MEFLKISIKEVRKTHL